MLWDKLGLLGAYIYIAATTQSDSLLGRLANDVANWKKYMPLIKSLLGQVKTIFRNPRRYPRESVIVISAVILTFLVIMLLVMTVLSLKRQYKIYKASRRVRKKLPREEVIKRLSITGGVLAVVMLAIAIGSSQPAFCSRCHSIETHYATWQKSAHKDSTSCLSCHYEPGVFGFLIGNVHGAQNLLAHFVKGDDIPRAIVSNAACLQCHRDIYSRTITDEREIKVRHKDLLSGGLICTNCHPDVAHSVKANRTFAMNSCVTCHNNKTASSKCSSCHKQDIAYKPDRTLDDWPKVKDVGLTCTGCHKPVTTQRCVNCHGLSLPHAAQFRKHHPMEAETRNGLCYKCHWQKMTENRMCGCHDPGEIHGNTENWYYGHRAVAKKNGAGCNCHGLSFCARCHDDADKVYPSGYAGGGGANQMHGGWNTGMQ